MVHPPFHLLQRAIGLITRHRIDAIVVGTQERMRLIETAAPSLQLPICSSKDIPSHSEVLRLSGETRLQTTPRVPASMRHTLREVKLRCCLVRWTE